MTPPPPPDGFVDRMAAEFVAQGFPRIPARVLMALMGTPDARLTSSELADAVGASPAAISGAVRYLSMLGMVRQLSLPGTRQHLYALADDEHPWYAATLTRRGVYDSILRVTRSEIARLPEGPVRDRVADMAAFLAYVEDRLPQLFREWQQVRTSSS